MRVAGFLKRHVIPVGLGVAIVPLLVLLAVQYQLLSRLEETSPAAAKLSLENRLDAVAAEVDGAYLVDARRALAVPASAIQEGPDDDVSMFATAPADGVKRYFIASLMSNKRAKVTTFDPATRRCCEGDPGSVEFWAALSAAFHSLNMMMDSRTVDPNAFEIDDKDPANHVVMKPIVDGRSRLVGVAGMIVDSNYFTARYLPAAVGASVKSHFSENELSTMGVVVLDESGKTVWSAGPTGRGAPVVLVPISNVYSKWRLGLAPNGPPHDQLARRYFVANLTITVLMLLVLAAMIVLALRAAAREMRLSQMKTDFVSNVSHELRTPLASIRVFGELMRHGRVADPLKVREYGELIENEGRRLTQLINNILDFSKIEAGTKRFTVENTDLARLVETTVAAFEPQARQLGFSIELSIPEEPLPPVSVDAAAIGQSVLNLLDNAVKYSGDSRQISVRVFRVGENGAVEVKDFGIGIAPEEHKRIFARFHRVSSSLVHDIKGSGLGLSLVDYIVTEHGGRITVASRPGRGSTFTILLPLAASDAQVRPAGHVEEFRAAT